MILTSYFCDGLKTWTDNHPKMWFILNNAFTFVPWSFIYLVSDPRFTHTHAHDDLGYLPLNPSLEYPLNLFLNQLISSYLSPTQSTLKKFKMISGKVEKTKRWNTKTKAPFSLLGRQTGPNIKFRSRSVEPNNAGTKHSKPVPSRSDRQTQSRPGLYIRAPKLRVMSRDDRQVTSHLKLVPVPWSGRSGTNDKSCPVLVPEFHRYLYSSPFSHPAPVTKWGTSRRWEDSRDCNVCAKTEKKETENWKKIKG